MKPESTKTDRARVSPAFAHKLQISTPVVNVIQVEGGYAVQVIIPTLQVSTLGPVATLEEANQWKTSLT